MGMDDIHFKRRYALTATIQSTTNVSAIWYRWGFLCWKHALPARKSRRKILSDDAWQRFARTENTHILREYKAHRKLSETALNCVWWRYAHTAMAKARGRLLAMAHSRYWCMINIRTSCISKIQTRLSAMERSRVMCMAEIRTPYNNKTQKRWF